MTVATEDAGGASTWRLRIALAAVVVVFILVVFVLAEAVARWLEPETVVHGSGAFDPHPVLGWLPTEGEVTIENHEFRATYEVNARRMNDRPVAETLGISQRRIIALGDSHTYALGVSQNEAWPNVLEELLFQGSPERGTVYNLGVVGYGLGQYLLRMRLEAEALDPQIVLVGFSMATDLYDIIPPRLGGFVYGKNLGRVYFDLDESGELIEVKDLEGATIVEEKEDKDASMRVRGMLAQLALYRRFKRSGIAMRIAANYQPGGKSLWPGMDSALKVERDETDQYRWSLASRIIAQIAQEAHADGRTVILVNIPYHLAQIYDEVWESSFGTAGDKYDRWIPSERLREISEANGIGFIDTTPRFVEEARRRGEWLHYRDDGHPTPEGHRLIAEVVAEALR